METLHRAGVKPVWVDRAGRIKQMHAMLRRRAEGTRMYVYVYVLAYVYTTNSNTLKPYAAEWARLLLDEPSSSVPASALPRLQERWHSRLEGLRSLKDDLGFVNAEIDLYNLQVRMCVYCDCVCYDSFRRAQLAHTTKRENPTGPLPFPPARAPPTRLPRHHGRHHTTISYPNHRHLFLYDRHRRRSCLPAGRGA